MTWQMYAGRVDGGFRHFGSRWYVEAYGHTEVVAVELHESPEGAYWGWLDPGAREPEMIWSDRLLFDACFTYGPDAEQERGRGRILRLDVRAVAAEPVSGTMTAAGPGTSDEALL